LLANNCMQADADLDCEYTPTSADYNDDYLYDTAVTASGTLRFRALAPGDHSASPIKIFFTGGGTGGSANLSVSGNNITVIIENNVTTSKTIYDAFSGSTLVEVKLLGSLTEDSVILGTLTLSGGRSQLDYLEYNVTDNGVPPLSATLPARITFRITPVNDLPVESAVAVAASTDEDTPVNFNLNVGSDVDHTNHLYYYFDQNTPIPASEGVLSGCMDLNGSDGLWVLTCTFTPYKNYSGITTFNYKVNDGTADSAGVTAVNITVTAVNDNPMICQYSGYFEAPECGLNHCVGTTSPVGVIAPASHSASKSVYYYEEGAALCWKSKGTSNTDWELDTNGNIFDMTVNQNEPLIARRLRFDEGGGDTAEDSQQLTVDITSSNPLLVPLTGIKMYWGGTGTTLTGEDATAARVFGDAGASEDSNDFRIEISPNLSTSGTSIITVHVVDDDATPRDVNVSFNVTVSDVGVIHNGWANIKSLGPKIGRDGVPAKARYACSYSETKCGNGGKCYGSGAPSSVVADQYNAIYMDDTDNSAPKCYRATAEVTEGDVTFSARQDEPVTIEIVGGGVSPTPVVTNISNRHLIVTIKSPETDSDDIVTFFNANTVAAGDCNAGTAGNFLDCIVGASTTNPGQIVAVTTGLTTLSMKDIYVAKFSGIVYHSYTSGLTVQYLTDATQVAGDGVATINGSAILVKHNAGTQTNIVAAINTLIAAQNGALKLEVFATSGATAITDQAATALTLKTANQTWKSMNSYCAISQSDLVNSCDNDTYQEGLGASCIGFKPPADVLNAGTYTNNNTYYDAGNNKCYRYNLLTPAWEQYEATGEVTLGWKPFTISGAGSISGYNVYRRLGDGTDAFDYGRPINFRSVALDATSFTDDYKNSREPPIPGTVYFYEVKPFVDSLSTTASEDHRFVRVMAPPSNKAFVHRWIVNQTMCEMMHSENRDDLDPVEALTYKRQGALNFNRCHYHGPGDAIVAGEHVYDIGKDLIVDQVEAGCAYTKGCTGAATDGSCIGTAAPGVGVTAADGEVYYDRSTANCYVKDTTWKLAETVALPGDATLMATAISSTYDRAKNPPLVKVGQVWSNNFCSNLTGVTANSIIGMAVAKTPRLPNRRHQIAFSMWDDALTDSDIETVEGGLAINSSSKCNSAKASGLETDFSDSVIPPISSLYTLPGMLSKSVRSLYTGSSQTETCQSRFGVQDHVGNVAEFVQDRMRCDAGGSYTGGFAVCYGVSKTFESTYIAGANNKIAPLDALDDTYWVTGDGNFPYYTMDGVHGPCSNTDVDSTCDDEMTSWTIENTDYSAGRWFLPVGLPGFSTFSDTYPTSTVGKSMFDIGSTNGITVAQLHDDSVIMNSGAFFSSMNGSGSSALERGCGAMTAGGGYNDNGGAGLWHFEMVPCHTAYGYYLWEDIVIRDIGAGLSSVKITSAAAIAEITPPPSLWMTATTSSTMTSLLSFIRSEADYTTVANVGQNFDAFYTNSSNVPSVFPGLLTKVDKSAYTNNRTDIGLRCVIEVDSDDGAGDYTENQF